jgi:hypothetical protein
MVTGKTQFVISLFGKKSHFFTYMLSYYRVHLSEQGLEAIRRGEKTYSLDEVAKELGLDN